MNNSEPLSVARNHRAAETIVDPEQHLVEIAPDNLAQRRRSADGSCSTQSDQFAKIFHSKPPPTELAMEIQSVNINVTIAR